MVTYLLATRVYLSPCYDPILLPLSCPQHANPKTVGYVTSGFWGGITIGRFAWGYFIPSYVLTLLHEKRPKMKLSSLTYTQRKIVILGCLYVV
jgi:hypothetical protein